MFLACQPGTSSILNPLTGFVHRGSQERGGDVKNWGSYIGESLRWDESRRAQPSGVAVGLEQWDLEQCVCHKLHLTGLTWLCVWLILSRHGLCPLSPFRGDWAGDESIYVQSLGFQIQYLFLLFFQWHYKVAS